MQFRLHRSAGLFCQGTSAILPGTPVQATPMTPMLSGGLTRVSLRLVASDAATPNHPHSDMPSFSSQSAICCVGGPQQDLALSVLGRHVGEFTNTRKEGAAPCPETLCFHQLIPRPRSLRQSNAGYLLPSPACARVIGGHHRSGRAIRGSNYSRSATRERQGQHQHQKLPHGHLPWFDANVSRIGAGEGDESQNCRLPGRFCLRD